MKKKTFASPPMAASGSRRLFLKTIGAAGAFAAGQPFFDAFVSKARADAPLPSQPNIILILSDQERAIRWFPSGWSEANLPGFTRLQQTGLTFNRAMCNTCMCTPSRNTIFTGLFPAQHMCKDTLTEGFTQSPTELQLDPTVPNLAKVMKAAGYEVVYKGKWHMSKGTTGCDDVENPADISHYGFDQWDPPDAGQDTKIENYGGGTADNDGRFAMDALAYLQEKIANPGGKPFCLVLSFVNPHDVLGYPGNEGTGGYTTADLVGDILLPPTVDEDLVANLKPTVQEETRIALAGLGLLPTPQMKLNYINFYGNVMKLVDSYVTQVLDLLEGSPAGQALRNDTFIIRTSDHGEMGMAHSGLRQKAFIAYEEAVRIGLVWSNPVLFPTAQSSDALVSHVDFLPTLASLVGVPDWEDYDFSGVDYSSLLLNPAGPPVQDYILFTFDDINAGQPAPSSGNGIVPPPNRIQMIRNDDYKYVRYFDGEGVAPDQEEFYDLRTAANGGTDTDPSTGLPVELRNISQWADDQRAIPLATPAQVVIRDAMKSQLATVVNERLQPRTRPPASPPTNYQISQENWTDADTDEAEAALAITFDTRANETYQLQTSTDLTNPSGWTDVGDPIAGTNGPVLICQPVPSSIVFYRVVWSATTT